MVLAYSILRLDGGEEISRNYLSALVDELIESVLAVGA